MNVGRRQLAGKQFLLIEVDHHLHWLTPVRERNDDPRDGHEEGADSHVGEVIELCGRHIVGADLDHGHRDGGGRQTHDQGRRYIGRQNLEDGLRNTDDIRFGPADIDPVLEKYIGDADAVIGVTMDVLNPFHRGGQEAFEEVRDAPFHPLRQQTGVHIDDGGNGNRDIRKHIGRHGPNAEAPEYQNENRHHDEGVRSLEGDDDELVHSWRQREAVGFPVMWTLRSYKTSLGMCRYYMYYKR